MMFEKKSREMGISFTYLKVGQREANVDQSIFDILAADGRYPTRRTHVSLLSLCNLWS
jgi:hypothetical protein